MFCCLLHCLCLSKKDYHHEPRLATPTWCIAPSQGLSGSAKVFFPSLALAMPHGRDPAVSETRSISTGTKKLDSILYYSSMRSRSPVPPATVSGKRDSCSVVAHWHCYIFYAAGRFIVQYASPRSPAQNSGSSSSAVQAGIDGLQSVSRRLRPPWCPSGAVQSSTPALREYMRCFFDVARGQTRRRVAPKDCVA